MVNQNDWMMINMLLIIEMINFSSFMLQYVFFSVNQFFVEDSTEDIHSSTVLYQCNNTCQCK